MTTVAFTEGDLGRQRANQRGIVLMIGAMACFVVNDSAAKLATALMPVSEVIAIRGVFATLFVLALILAHGLQRHFRLIWQWRVAARGGMESVVAFASILGLSHVPLGIATAIGQIAPILLLAFSALLLKEKVDARRWAAVFVCFAGVILVARPSTEGLNLYVLATLACAVLAALRDLVTHRIGSSVPTLLVTLGTTTIVSLAGFAGSAMSAWRPLAPADLSLLMVGSLSLVGGHALVIAAYRGTDVSAVSPFRYSALALSVLAGLVVFGDLPDAWTGAGMILIVLSGLYAAGREMRRRRAIEAALDKGA